jgi:hypothetical protein
LRGWRAATRGIAGRMSEALSLRPDQTVCFGHYQTSAHINARPVLRSGKAAVNVGLWVFPDVRAC